MPNIVCFQTQKQITILNNIGILLKSVLIDLRARTFVHAKTSAWTIVVTVHAICRALLIIVHLTFLSLGYWSCPMFWLFCMGAHVSVDELDNAMQFCIFSRVSVFLWYNWRLARRFTCFLQYMPQLEVLACSFNTDFNHAWHHPW